MLPAGNYLGCFLGPLAGVQQWKLAIAKWASRTCAIAASHAPLSVTIALYNSRAVTTLGYLAQLSPIPDSVRATERALLARLLHIPGNTFDHAGYFNLPVNITSVVSLSAAALMRAATVTLKSSWPQ